VYNPEQHENPDFMAKVTKYTQIFPKDSKQSEYIYNKLRSFWHPDKHPPVTPEIAARIFSMVQTMYKEFTKRMEEGTYGYGRKINFQIKNLEFEYTYFGENEVNTFGVQYTGRATVAFDFSDSIQPYLANWQTAFKKMRSLADRFTPFAKDFHHQLNAAPEVNQTNDKSGYVIKIVKTSDHLCLDHILKRGPLPAEHVAWVISRLLNLGRFIEEADVVNLDICTRNTFIHPAEHSLIVVDGWQYGSSWKTNVNAAPDNFIRMFPGFLSGPRLHKKHVIGMIKKLAKTCLGDSIGVKLAADKSLPKPMIQWLNTTRSSTTLAEEMVEWEKVKQESFGPPKFINLCLSEKDIYL
jgi:hypothetical protein